MTHEKLVQLKRERDLEVVARCDKPLRALCFSVAWQVHRRDGSSAIYQQVTIHAQGVLVVPNYGQLAA